MSMHGVSYSIEIIIKNYCYRKSNGKENDVAMDDYDPDWVDSDQESDQESESESELKSKKTNKREKWKASAKEKSKKYRENQTPAQRERNNEMARLRMKKLRERKKLFPKRKLTASEIARQRKKWREEKRKQRSRITPDLKKHQEMEGLKRKLKMLSPDEFSSMVQQSITPRKKKYMVKRGIYNSPSTRRKLDQMKGVVGCFKEQVKELAQKTDKLNRIKDESCYVIYCQKEKVICGSILTWRQMAYMEEIF